MTSRAEIALLDFRVNALARESARIALAMCPEAAFFSEHQ